MKLSDLVSNKAKPPAHFSGKYKIPWDEPGFSARMLKEHLSQDHDWASRPFAEIDEHVAWIHSELCQNRKSRILDIGCGPGFYASRLAGVGHTVVGIDFGPASIKYANQHNPHPERCEYRLEDVRESDFGSGHDLAIMVYGELNAFPPAEAEKILTKALTALNPGGQLLLEVNPYEAVKRFGTAPNSWSQSESGLFSDKPHICLTSHDWNVNSHSAQSRFIVIDLESNETEQYFSTTQAYTDEGYLDLLGRVGFANIKLLPGFGRKEIEEDHDLMLLLARKA